MAFVTELIGVAGLVPVDRRDDRAAATSFRSPANQVAQVSFRSGS
jgi:hypothetical protein